jgi:conjugal transfer pilus assembly protein TraL
MENTESRYVFINKYIEALPFFMMWEADIILVWACFFGLGFMFLTGIKMLVAVAAGFFFASLYGKHKRKSQKGFFFHIVYALGLRKTKKILPSHARIFHGG